MRRPAVLLALVLALAAAGCGGGGSASSAGDADVKEVNAAQAGLAKRFDSLQGAAAATSTPAQDRRTLRAYEDAVTAAVTRLRAADPPSDVKPLHQEFVGEIAAYGTEVRHAREALGAGTPERALAAQRRLVTRVGRITAQINDTIDAINRRLRG